MQCCQQLTGINFIFYFGTTFFQQLGTISDPFFISLVTTLVNVLSTPLSFWVIEKFGRRFLLIWGACGMIMMQFVVAIIGVTSGKEDNHDDGAVKSMIAFICLNIFFFAVTWGPVAWVVVGESFPLPIRSRGVAISTASNWFWNTVHIFHPLPITDVLTLLQIIATITPYMVGTSPGSANLGPKVFFIWGSLCIVSLAFAYFLVPEMKGLSLEQVDKMMEEVSPRKSAAWMPTTTFAEEMRRINAAKSSSQVPVHSGSRVNSPYDDGKGSFQQYPHPHTPSPQEWQQSPQPYGRGSSSPNQYPHTPPPGQGQGQYQRQGSPLQQTRQYQEIYPQPYAQQGYSQPYQGQRSY